MKEVDLGNEFLDIFNLFENSNDNFFLTGNAGSGKTTLLNYFLKNTKKSCVVLAPTGVAAIQIGGSTVHSFFGFPFRPLFKNDPEIKKWGNGHPKSHIIKKVNTFIIDEVSMLRADILDGIDQSLRLNYNELLPFGGKQVIFVGDVYQLPPVITQQEKASLPYHEYESPYFFSAEAFSSCAIRIIMLNKIFRQNDPEFIDFLNKIRLGSATQREIDFFNNSCFNGEEKSNSLSICLCSINAAADRINNERLQLIRNTTFEYKGKVEGIFNEKQLPVEMFLKLKVGAQVMITKNDLQGRWVNGTIGEIDALNHGEIKVRMPDKKVFAIEQVVWENIEYKWDNDKKEIKTEIKGSYRHYPLRLAWAVTIHKSQGLTFDNIAVDLGRGAFAHGQLYVALSRCRSLDGISLKTKIALKDMIIDEAVINFSERYFRKLITSKRN